MQEYFRAARPFSVLKDSELSVQVPNKLCVLCIHFTVMLINTLDTDSRYLQYKASCPGSSALTLLGAPQFPGLQVVTLNQCLTF